MKSDWFANAKNIIIAGLVVKGTSGKPKGGISLGGGGKLNKKPRGGGTGTVTLVLDLSGGTGTTYGRNVYDASNNSITFTRGTGEIYQEAVHAWTGTNSLRLRQSGGDISFVNPANFTMDKDFTIEGAVDWDGNLGSNGCVFGFNGGTTLSLRRTATATNRWELLIGNVVVITGANGAVTNNSPHHFAVTRKGTTVRLLVDGAEIGNTTSSATFGQAGSTSYIGRKAESGENAWCWLGGFQVTNGVALYTGTYTPPTSFTNPNPLTYMLFGSGVDGNVTTSGSTTLTRPMHYNNLTVSGNLWPRGWPIFVKGTLTINANSYIGDDAGYNSGTATNGSTNVFQKGADGWPSYGVDDGSIQNGVGFGSNCLGGNGGNAGTTSNFATTPAHRNLPGGTGGVGVPPAQIPGETELLAMVRKIAIGLTRPVEYYPGCSGGRGAYDTNNALLAGAGGSEMGVFAKTIASGGTTTNTYLTARGFWGAAAGRGSTFGYQVGGGSGGGGVIWVLTKTADWNSRIGARVDAGTSMASFGCYGSQAGPMDGTHGTDGRVISAVIT